MTGELVPVTRPDGRVYRPRKAPRAVEVDNPDGQGNEPGSYIYVLGTHDVARAYELASARWRGVEGLTAEQTWLRLMMRDGDQVFDHDPVRGAAAVIFEVFG